MAQRIEITPLIKGTEVIYSGLTGGTPDTTIVDVAKLTVDEVPLTHILPYEARVIVNNENKPMTVDQFSRDSSNAIVADAVIASRIVDNSTKVPTVYFVKETKDQILAAIIA